MTHGTLFVVATPIGNLADLSSRGRETLDAVTLIAAEDTRHTGRLLSNFGIETPQMALHEHNEARVVDELVERLTGGESIALVSDAGTPLISDPGYRLVVAAHAAGVPVASVPGPSAITGALSVAGLPTDRFCFEGFLPAKREARRSRLRALCDDSRTTVFFVSVHKLRATVADVAEVFGRERPAFLARELTKLHEQGVRATAGDLEALLDSGEVPAKGEVVLITAGAPAAAASTDEPELRRWLQELAAVMPGRQAVDIVTRVSGRRRNEIYRLLVDVQAAAEAE